MEGVIGCGNLIRTEVHYAQSDPRLAGAADDLMDVGLHRPAPPVRIVLDASAGDAEVLKPSERRYSSKSTGGGTPPHRARVRIDGRGRQARLSVSELVRAKSSRIREV